MDKNNVFCDIEVSEKDSDEEVEHIDDGEGDSDIGEGNSDVGDSSQTLTEKYNQVKVWLTNHVHKTITPKHEEFEKMCSMLRNHPNYSSWVHKDPEGFKITRSPKNKALQVLVKLNGKWRIVSWVACARGKTIRKHTDSNQLTQAMRFAVRKQIKMWRNGIGNAYNSKCVLCNCNVKEKLEVDHYPEKFSSIRDSFMKQHEGTTPSIYWDKNKTSYRFSKKESLNGKWQRYHLKHATYRWLCADCNKKTNCKSN